MGKGKKMEKLSIVLILLFNLSANAGSCSEFSANFDKDSASHLDHARCKLLNQSSSYDLHKKKNKIIRSFNNALDAGNDLLTRDNKIIKYGSKLVTWLSDKDESFNNERLTGELYAYFKHSQDSIQYNDFSTPEKIIQSSKVLEHIQQTLTLVESAGGDPKLAASLYLGVLSRFAQKLSHGQAETRSMLKDDYVTREELNSSIKSSVNELVKATKIVNDNLDSEELDLIKNEVRESINSINNEVRGLTSNAITSLESISLLTSQIEELQKQGKESSDLYKSLFKDLEKRKSILERDKSIRSRSYQESRFGVTIFSSFLTVFGESDAAYQIETFSHNAINIAEAIDTIAQEGFSNLGTSASLGPYAVVATGVAQIIGTMSESKSPEQQIMEQLQKLSEQISTLRKEMHQRFDHLELVISNQNTILLNSIERISNEQQEMLEVINDTLNLVDNKSTYILEVLQGYSSEELELKLQRIKYECIEYEEIFSGNMSKNQFDTCMLDINNWVIDYSRLKVFTGVEGNDLETSTNLLNDNNLQYKYSSFARIINILLKDDIIPEDVPNMYLWSKGVDFYFTMIKKYPSYNNGFDSKGTLLKRMINSGKTLQKFFKLLNNKRIISKLEESIHTKNSELSFEVQSHIRDKFEGDFTTYQYNKGISLSHDLTVLKANPSLSDETVNSITSEVELIKSQLEGRKDLRNCYTRIEDGKAFKDGCIKREVYETLSLKNISSIISPNHRMIKQCSNVLPSIENSFTKKYFSGDIYYPTDIYTSNPFIPKLFALNEYLSKGESENVELCYNITGTVSNDLKGNPDLVLAEQLSVYAVYKGRIINSTSLDYKKVITPIDSTKKMTSCFSSIKATPEVRTARIQESIINRIMTGHSGLNYYEKCIPTKLLSSGWLNLSLDEQKSKLGKEQVSKLLTKTKDLFKSYHISALMDKKVKDLIKDKLKYKKILKNLVVLSKENALFHSESLADAVVMLESDEGLYNSQIFDENYSINLKRILGASTRKLSFELEKLSSFKPNMLYSSNPLPASFDRYFSKLLITYYDKFDNQNPIAEHEEALLIKKLVSSGNQNFLYNVKDTEKIDIFSQIVVTPSYSRKKALSIVESMNYVSVRKLIKRVTDIYVNSESTTVKKMAMDFLLEQKTTSLSVVLKYRSNKAVDLLRGIIGERTDVLDYCIQRLTKESSVANLCSNIFRREDSRFGENIINLIEKKDSSSRNILMYISTLKSDEIEVIISKLDIDKKMSQFLDNHFTKNYREFVIGKKHFTIELQTYLNKKIDLISNSEAELKSILAKLSEEEIIKARKIIEELSYKILHRILFNNIVNETQKEVSLFDVSRSQILFIIDEVYKTKNSYYLQNLTNLLKDFSDEDDLVNEYIENNDDLASTLIYKLNLHSMSEELTTKVRSIYNSLVANRKTLVLMIHTHIHLLKKNQIYIEEIIDQVETFINSSKGLNEEVYTTYSPLFKAHRRLVPYFQTLVDTNRIPELSIPLIMNEMNYEGIDIDRAKKLLEDILQYKSITIDESNDYPYTLKVTVYDFIRLIENIYKTGNLDKFSDIIYEFRNYPNQDLVNYLKEVSLI